MARRYGRMNRYDSRLRRCAISGLRFYESEMVEINGAWVALKYLDEDRTIPKTRRINAPTAQDVAMHQDCFELDSGGDLMPRDFNMLGTGDYSAFDNLYGELAPKNDVGFSIFFELDGNLDVRPKS